MSKPGKDCTKVVRVHDAVRAPEGSSPMTRPKDLSRTGLASDSSVMGLCTQLSCCRTFPHG